MYAVTLADSAKRELAAIDRSIGRRIALKLRTLAENPRPKGVVKLEGEKNIWRIRIGDYRVLYAVFDREHEVVVSAIKHRGKAYRK